jgi:hypothetical protein
MVLNSWKHGAPILGGALGRTASDNWSIEIQYPKFIHFGAVVVHGHFWRGACVSRSAWLWAQ